MDGLAGGRPVRKTIGRRRDKLLFAPVPMRAAKDDRLTGSHFRVLTVVAAHDRLGRNGQGCWIGRERLAEEAGLSQTHVSDALSDLRSLGYITSERHPFNRRTLIHRVVYDTSEIRDQSLRETRPVNGTYQGRIGPDFSPNRSGFRPEKVQSENVKSLNGNEDQPCNIFKIDNIEDKKEGIEVSDLKDFAEARATEKRKTEIENAECYLSEVQSLISDEATRAAANFECGELSRIAEDFGLPEDIRTRAIHLRDLARAQ